MSTSAECLFCRIFETGEEQRKWHDRILFERDEIAVLTGLGAQREGYLLIVPRAHAFSSAELSEPALSSLEEVKQEVTHVLNQVYGPCVFFEHGACGHTRRAGGCIDHVHIHAIPMEKPIVDFASREIEIADRDRTFVHVSGHESLRKWIQRPYVAIQDQKGSMFIADGEGLPGQFMRRVVAKAIGSPKDWDYEAHRHEERMRATIEKLAELFGGIEEVDPRYAQQWHRDGPLAPLVYVARAVDNRPAPDVRQVGETLRQRVREAGFAAVDPVASTFPRTQVPMQENLRTNDFGRVRSDLAWLRRSDAVIIDMHLEDWSYVGCVCELVYAYQWDIPTIIVAGSSVIKERLWLRYHATKIVEDIDEAIDELNALFASPGTRRDHLDAPSVGSVAGEMAASPEKT
jgi:ATP adenylyltransferase